MHVQRYVCTNESLDSQQEPRFHTCFLCMRTKFSDLWDTLTRKLLTLNLPWYVRDGSMARHVLCITEWFLKLKLRKTTKCPYVFLYFQVLQSFRYVDDYICYWRVFAMVAIILSLFAMENLLGDNGNLKAFGETTSKLYNHFDPLSF